MASGDDQQASNLGERAYSEWRHAFINQRLRVLYIVGLIANPGFSLLDILVHGDVLRELTIIRLILEAGLLLGFFFVRIQGELIPQPVLLTFWVLFPNILIVHMTLLTGGFSSQYYNGLSLVWLSAGVIVPVSWRAHLVAQVGTLAYYYVINAWLSAGLSDRSAMIEHPFFLVWYCVAIIISVTLYERLQRAEFDARQAEGQARADLETSNRRLLELDRLKSEFFANISHELRTPLTLIFGAFKTLFRRADPDNQEMVSAGLRNTGRLLFLINELLELARFDSGRTQMHTRCIDMATLIRGVAANFDSGVSRRVHYRGLDQPIPIEVDPRHMKKVLYNLLSNAFKFSDPDSGEVWLRLSTVNGMVELEVEDNGIGIPPEQLGRIFERFTQVEGSATRRFEGSGIGLALVKEVITRHGGTVAVESEVGRGSTFIVKLPRGNATQETLVSLDDEETVLPPPDVRTTAPEEPAGLEAGDRRPLVLIAEDNPDMRRYVATVLSPHYRLVLAKDGVEAIERLQTSRPDLIITDAMMPRMSGDDLLKAVRSLDAVRSVPVIFLTARAGTDARLETLHAGADDYICKPFDERELLARVQNLIRTRLQEQALLSLQKEKLARFLPAQLGELILSGTADDFLNGHRREITVLFIDLRGFTSFSETAAPEDVMAVLRQYQHAMGEIVTSHQGTLERFAGDGMMIFLNDPVAIPDHPQRGVRMAVALRARIAALQSEWHRRGFQLGAGIGLATGHATIGVVGFDQRKDYAAIGPVTNLAARLCSEAAHGQIVISERLMALVKDEFICEVFGTLALKGFRDPVSAYSVLGPVSKATPAMVDSRETRS
ncbi:MAG TPA: ATP-binding protein [Nitrospirales bacterium]|nr:ATP-binding protein [Nitrospirales bacterium]